MASFNPQNAVVYGLTAQQFYNLFTNYYTTDLGTITSLFNSYATVYPFSATNWPSNNAQAIEDLFPSINTGPIVPFYTTQENQEYTLDETNFYPFSNTSAVTITPLTATANLSDAVFLGEEDVVGPNSSFTFTFIPGAVQSQALSYEIGTTISNSVTNGITNTTTSGSTVTVTTGVTATGTIPGASTAINASVAQAWTEQESQAINYSESETDTVNTNVTDTVTVDIDTATENSDGTYSWTSSTGQTFTLIPGNSYISEVSVSTSSYTTPVPNIFNISGPDMSLELFILGGFYDSYKTVTQNVEQAIYTANAFGYSQYSEVDPSNFTYQTGSIDQAVYAGLISSGSVTGVNATVTVLPVATTPIATPQPRAGETAQLASATEPMQAMSIPEETTELDLQLAANRLSSSYGIYYNNINSEDDFVTNHVEISGYDHATVRVGNLDYTLKNFSDSTVSAGSGNNRILIGETDVNNTFSLGSGNNEVKLNGSFNKIKMGDGANWVDITGGAGTNFVVAGDGPTTLTFNSDDGFTQVSNWDVSEDAMLFSPDFARTHIYATFDPTRWAYDVYVNNKHVANILTTGGLKLANELSTVFPQTYAAPMPYNLQSNEGFVSGLYVDAFARTADSAGLSFWTEQLEAGVSRKAVIQDFLVSSEYNLEHLSNSEYVDGLYNDILGRQDDAVGLTYWIDQLDSGISRAKVVDAFLGSAEFNNLIWMG